MLKVITPNLTPERLNTLDFSVFNEIFELMLRHRTKLFDDEFFKAEKPCIQRVYEIIQKYTPYFWLFFEIEERAWGTSVSCIPEIGPGVKFLGFSYFYDFIPLKNRVQSASATICFKKSAWGTPARIAAKKLLIQAFYELNLFKIKAECYSSNLLIPNFLRRLGFQREGILKREVCVGGKLTDTELWAVFNPKLLKLQTFP